MRTADGPLVPAESGRLRIRPGRGLGAHGALARAGARAWHGWALRSGRCLVAAAVAAAVALGPSPGVRAAWAPPGARAGHGPALGFTALNRFGAVHDGNARARLAIRTLACMEQVAAGSAAVRRDSCMSGLMAERPHQRYEAFAGPGSRMIPAILNAMREAGAVGPLRQMFPADRELAEEMLHKDWRVPATGVPARPCVAPGGNGGQLSCGERASLPGRSTRFRMIWLVCAHCSYEMTCMFYDEGDAPVCVSPLHGQLEIRR